MSDLILLLISAVLVALCGMFVAAEFAFVTVDRAAVERSGDRRAPGLLAALRGLSTQLSGAQLGITVTNLAIGFLAERAIAHLIEGPLQAAGVPQRALASVAVTIAMVAATAATMIYGELVPKNLAIADPLRVGLTVARFSRGFATLAAWPIRLLNGCANWLLARFGIEAQEELASARSPEELMSLLGHSAARGTLPSATADLLTRSLAFDQKSAADVLTPRVDMLTVGQDQPVSAVIDLTIRSGRSRFPVTGQDIDDIVGAVHLQHAVRIPVRERDRVRVSEVMVAPVLVPASLHLDSLLDTLRDGGLQLAVVVDEFGGVDGVVTAEDLIEELVGNVTDEHDRQATMVRQGPDGRWHLSGQLRPDEIADATGVRLPVHSSYETVGGLIAKELGRIPVNGDVVELPGARLEVEHMVGRRVERVLLGSGTEGDS